MVPDHLLLDMEEAYISEKMYALNVVDYDEWFIDMVSWIIDCSTRHSIPTYYIPYEIFIEASARTNYRVKVLQSRREKLARYKRSEG